METPDSWDQAPSEGLSGLSISAKPFVPNVNACAFVPKFGGGSTFVPQAAPPANPAPAPVPVTADECVKNSEPEETDTANGKWLTPCIIFVYFL